ncbi:MAG: hypothetical protein LZF63_06855 [Nitrosomonas sp.]|nr:hypothetical protein [Nitrosomonas sp.]
MIESILGMGQRCDEESLPATTRNVSIKKVPAARDVSMIEMTQDSLGN